MILVAFTHQSNGQTQYSSLSNLQPTSGVWQSTTTSVIIPVDFGPLRGLGTITIAALGGGSINVGADNPVSFEDLGYSVRDTVLSNGDLLHLSNAVVFSPINAGATAGGVSGFSLTFSLNSGVFEEGDVFAAGSLDYRNTVNRHTYLQVGSAFGGVEAGSVTMPADLQGGFTAAPLLAVSGSEDLPNGVLYTANGGTSTGPLYISEWGFFRLNADTSSFTTYFTSTGAQQGVVFSVATPTPEPSGAVLITMAGLLTLTRRQRLRKHA